MTTPLNGSVELTELNKKALLTGLSPTVIPVTWWQNFPCRGPNGTTTNIGIAHKIKIHCSRIGPHLNLDDVCATSQKIADLIPDSQIEAWALDIATQTKLLYR